MELLFTVTNQHVHTIKKGKLVGFHFHGDFNVIQWPFYYAILNNYH